MPSPKNLKIPKLFSNRRPSAASSSLSAKTSAASFPSAQKSKTSASSSLPTKSSTEPKITKSEEPKTPTIPTKPESETIITLENISKRYGYGHAESFALQSFSLTVKRGEFIMIMGPSGCGKTTLLNIIGLLDKATSGSYLLNDKNVERISRRRQARLRSRKIGFIFQNFNLISTLPVVENVALPLVYAGYSKSRRHRIAADTLARFHLQEREYYMPWQLSGGQQQRVAIARSLVANPEIILADEPTGNLDSRSSHIVMEELRNIHAAGNTIIMVTHNPALTTYATRVIHMLDGHIDTDIKTVSDADLPQPITEKTPSPEIILPSAKDTPDNTPTSILLPAKNPSDDINPTISLPNSSAENDNYSSGNIISPESSAPISDDFSASISDPSTGLSTSDDFPDPTPETNFGELFVNTSSKKYTLPASSHPDSLLPSTPVNILVTPEKSPKKSKKPTKVTVKSKKSPLKTAKSKAKKAKDSNLAALKSNYHKYKSQTQSKLTKKKGTN